MITKSEILEIAAAKKVSSYVIEKDYVLGWMLAGIYNDPILKDNLVFKGGTCLKKCFFDDYRFSEDLDFTIIDPTIIEEAWLIEKFNEISTWVYKNSGIELALNRTDFEIYSNKKGISNCQGKLYYRGPISPTSPRSWPRIKIDLTAEEILARRPITSMVYNDYKDYDKAIFKIHSYCFDELIAEKLRAIQERCMPRDVYDVVNCIDQQFIAYNFTEIKNILEVKCNYKGIKTTTCELIQNYKSSCKTSWETQLVHQLPQLPAFENSWNRLNSIIQTITEL